ncbi:hypothetical protein LOTGIDRAFT_238469 [Lottia gigantea]|uniref:Uncharacterized protein n=1 Tax=Lottia gigantea TaxID=225164 RepID=V4AU66_LOTGI|nr:hypothetical protein LOTGIDRAFT_238469 [Lottia gigantea]ESP00828.1 hypothetical protein LOTGIDRAFT_238469 [Lottia gigantea]
MYTIPIANIISLVIIRGKIREQRGIAGSTINDLMLVSFCTLCTLVQEAQEVQGSAPAGVSMVRE